MNKSIFNVINTIKFNVFSGILCGLSSLFNKIGFLNSKDSYFPALIGIIIGLYINSLMIFFFYKSLKVFGVSIATLINFSFNVLFTFLFDNFFFKSTFSFQSFTGMSMIMTGNVLLIIIKDEMSRSDGLYMIKDEKIK